MFIEIFNVFHIRLFWSRTNRVIIFFYKHAIPLALIIRISYIKLSLID